MTTGSENATSSCPQRKYNSSPRRKVLVTGASGYLGQTFCEVLAEEFDLLRMDIRETPGPGEFFLGSVTEKGDLDRACRRVDCVILAHMAPNRTAAYDWPDLCMDINVKGAALALEAAARNHIKRVVLISSVSVVWEYVREKRFLTQDLPCRPAGIYGMTKALQEEVARYYHQFYGIEFAVLRPAYVLREASLVNKYGENVPAATWQCIDPLDIAQAAAAALKLDDLKYEIFHLMAGPGAEDHVDIDMTKRRLGWNPQHRFQNLPVELL